MEKHTFDQIITGKFNAIINNHSGKDEEVNKRLRKSLLSIFEKFITSDDFQGTYSLKTTLI
jgi:hypothetical protein